jgi:hypothetical protein
MTRESRPHIRRHSARPGPICGTARDRIRPSARPDPGPPRARSGRAGALRVALSLAAASPRIAEASVRLGVTLATERDELRRPTRQRLPFCPGDEHSGAADGQVSSAVSVSQGSRACKQKRSSVDVVDETAPSGAKRLPRRRDRSRRDAVTRPGARSWLLLPQPSDALDTTRLLARRADRRSASKHADCRSRARAGVLLEAGNAVEFE